MSDIAAASKQYLENGTSSRATPLAASCSVNVSKPLQLRVTYETHGVAARHLFSPAVHPTDFYPAIRKEKTVLWVSVW